MGESHRYRNRAKRIFKPEWVAGTGPFASVAFCRVTTVQLYDTLAEAERAKQRIDEIACGGQCHRAHEVFDLTSGWAEPMSYDLKRWRQINGTR